MVLRLCRALVGPVAADDVWSETFLAALRAYPDLRPGSNVAAWLTTIAQRKAIDEVRRAKRTPRPVGSVDDRAVTDPGLDPADGDLRAALDGLTPNQRAAVVFHHVAGLPYADIGEILGTSEAAARRRAADGMARLRATFVKGSER